MKIFKTLIVRAVVIGVSLLASSTAFAEVQLTMLNGRVSLIAKDATIRQILTEWARVGQAKIVNLEKLSGAPITIELHDVPESQALDIVLRSLVGCMAAPWPIASRQPLRLRSRRHHAAGGWTASHRSRGGGAADLSATAADQSPAAAGRR